MKTCVIIPAVNEARHIGFVLEGIRPYGIPVVVIDDGSSDETSAVAKEKGAVVLRNRQNLGKGAALIRGFQYAVENHFDAVLTMDGDGQHDPQDIPFFLRHAEYSSNGIVIGNRMGRARGMPLVRLATNWCMSWLLSCVVRQSVPDTQCGFRLIKSEVLKRLDLRTKKFETESEIIIKASRAGFKVKSIPIKTLYAQTKSQIDPLIDTLRFIKLLAYETWRAQN